MNVSFVCVHFLENKRFFMQKKWIWAKTKKILYQKQYWIEPRAYLCSSLELRGKEQQLIQFLFLVSVWALIWIANLRHTHSFTCFVALFLPIPHSYPSFSLSISYFSLHTCIYVFVYAMFIGRKNEWAASLLVNMLWSNGGTKTINHVFCLY